MKSRMKAIIVGAAAVAALSVWVLPASAKEKGWTENGWTKLPTKSFAVSSLKIDDLFGKLSIDVKDSGPVELTISGKQDIVHTLEVRKDGNTLRISGDGSHGVWDWRSWFDFRKSKSKPDLVNVHLVAPRGTAISVDTFLGKARIGDTEGRMDFETAGNADVGIGNVADTKISMAGSGRVRVGRVNGSLHVETAGSGEVVTGNAKDVHIEIAGAGAAKVGDVAGDLHVEIAGAGNFAANTVNGPVHLEIAGSGSVDIAGGEANPLHIETFGSGDISFGGTAVNPHLEAMGSGRVKLKAYRGELKKEGNIDLKIGD